MTATYQNAKIYRIVSDQTNMIYIGSTIDKLNKRLTNHICNYNKYLNGNKMYCSSYEILKYDDYKIELIELYPCDNKNELHEKEQYYLTFYKDICVNKQKAYTGLTKIEYNKERYQNNKDKIQEYKKEYYQLNREKLLERNRKYKQDNKDKIKQYYQNNKDKILEKNKEKITCACGSIVRKSDLSRHQKTKKHINYINNNK